MPHGRPVQQPRQRNQRNHHPHQPMAYAPHMPASQASQVGPISYRQKLMRDIAFSLNAWVVFFLTGRFPASVPGSADSRWHVHEPAHGFTAPVPAGLVSRQLPRRRFQPEVPGRRGSIPGLHLPGGEGRLHELPTRLLPAKLCLPILKYQPPGW